MIKTIATKPNESPKHVKMTAAEIEQRQNDEDKFLAEKPFNDWLQEIAAYDAKMPRHLEDNMLANGAEKYDPYLQKLYNEKRELRKRKPKK